MNWLDIAILLGWALMAAWGGSVGLMTILFHLVTLAVSLAVASRMGPLLGGLFAPLSEREEVQTVAGFVVVFAVLFIASGVISFMMRRVLGIVPFFGMANRLGGMAIGVLAGFVVLSGLLVGVQKLQAEDVDETIDNSAFGSFLVDHFDVVIRGIKLIPGDWENNIIDRMDRTDVRSSLGQEIPDAARMNHTAYATIGDDIERRATIGIPIVGVVPPS